MSSHLVPFPLRHRFFTRLSVTCVLALTAVAALAFSGAQVIGPRASRAAEPSPGGMSDTAVGATITVNSTADSVGNDGVCTLREAVTAATNDTASGPAPGECVAGSGVDTINISVSGTIDLMTDHISITTDVSIVGPGSNLLTVRRGGSALHRIFFVNAATISISGMTITNGRVPAGGGAGGGIVGGGSLTLTDVVISGNRASDGVGPDGNGGSGGGISLRSGSLTMTNVTVRDNNAGNGTSGPNGGAGGRGGGIEFGPGTLTMTNCTVSGNSAGNGNTGTIPFSPGGAGGDGGGIFGEGTMILTNTTISSNSKGAGATPGLDGNGNAIFIAPGTTTITNSTITGDFFVGGTKSLVTNTGATVSVRNTIIARNLFGGSGPDISGSFNSLGNNIVGNADGAVGFTHGSNGDQVGNGTTSVNPLLAPLGNYGGSTQTHALLPGGPAIDAGTNTGAPAQDQRGVGRVGAVDIGSFESRGFTLAVRAGSTPQNTPVKSFFPENLSATISSAFGEPVSGGRITWVAPPGAVPSGTFGNVTTATFPAGPSGVAIPAAFRANGFAGSYNVTASGSGIASPAIFSLTNTPSPTDTSLSSSVNPSSFGQSVTFTATVISLTTPTGTVQFKDNGVNLGGPVALDSAGQASIETSTLTTGTHTITAVYSGDANSLTSTGTLAGGQVVRPTISVNDVSVTEGDSGTINAVFNVTLSSSSTSTITANFATADGTGSAPADYLSNNGSLTFDPGQTVKTISVTVNGDISFEADETFFVNLSNATNATFADSQGLGTILNDDAEGGRISFDRATFNTTENSGSATIAVTRTGDTSRAATVDYATSDLSASERSDYILALGTLSFAAGETSKSFIVLINQDSYAEGTESLSLSLSNPGGGAVLSLAASTLEIADDVPESSGNSIDGTDAFVRQHYHDFLNRLEDPSGLAFWTNEIASCGADAGCIDFKRASVSQAFFLSIEFQRTGYQVFRVYKATFTDSVQRPKGLPRFREFLKNTQELQRGVIVGQGNWEQDLAANVQGFVTSWVRSSEFVAEFPTTMTAQEFVDKLFLNSEVTPTQTERDAAIAAFGVGGTEGRANALLSATNSGSVYNRQYNPAFVLMQYFGYLRRNPNDAPEPGLNYDGYEFWLNKLNQFSLPGEDVRTEAVARQRALRAEMVRSFLVSGEYRQRFGP